MTKRLWRSLTAWFRNDEDIDVRGDHYPRPPEGYGVTLTPEGRVITYHVDGIISVDEARKHLGY